MTDRPEIPEGTLVWCQFHKGQLLSIAREGRRAQIGRKPAHEVATRQEWYRTVQHPERLPQPVIDAARTLDKAWRSYEVPGLSLSDVPRLYLVLQLDHAYLALCQVHNAHRDEMEALHKEECPGCPWDYESQQMVFPPKGVCS